MRITIDDDVRGEPRALVPLPAPADPRPLTNPRSSGDPRPLDLRVDHEETPATDGRRSAERKGLTIAVIGHLALFGALSANLSSPPPPVPGSPMEVTIFDPGIPSFGDPNGDDAPPRPSTTTAAPVDAQPAPVPETEEAVDPEAPTSAVSETPTPAPDPQPKPDPAPERPAQTPQQAASQQPSTAPARPAVTPSQDVGTGALAVGARTHGDAKGLDASLSAVVGRAVATRMRACWDPPTSGVPRDAASILVVRYARDGTIEGTPTVTRLVNQRETQVTQLNQWEASAVDALRRCSPLGLSPVLYPYWREVEVQLFGAPGA